ncbi:MAG TPA: alpha/beta hydrolase [Burkholderiaceae bacterium]|nr:alpha/beta hydrolase [Burkholderiaceae bacterium]
MPNMTQQATLTELDPLSRELLLRAAAMVSAVPADALTPQRRRELQRAGNALYASPQNLPSVERRDLRIDLPQRSLPARLYKPKADARPTAASDVLLVFFHGGGWVTGDLETHDNACAFLTDHIGCQILSVEYRKAPECAFPAPCDDAAQAYRWAQSQVEALGCRRIAIGGDSSGGHVAAYAMYANADVPTAAALLFYPVTSVDFERTSYAERGAGPGLTADGMRWFWGQFLGSSDAVDDVRALPMRQQWLRKPPATVMAQAWHDPLHDEGVAYAQLLRDAGAEVHLHTAHDMAHGYLRQCLVVPAAQAHVRQVAGSLLGVLATGAA